MTDPLTEDERAIVERFRRYESRSDRGPAVSEQVLAIIDRLSAAPADHRERVPEGEVMLDGQRWEVMRDFEICDCPESHRHGTGGGGCDCCQRPLAWLRPVIEAGGAPP